MIENCPFFVYTLTDPAEPDRIRYVGVTGALPQRWTTHLCCAKANPLHPLYVWWNRLSEAGREPVMQVFWQGGADLAERTEAETIAQFRAAGFDLLNQNSGGSGNRGLKLSEETRKRMSEASKGKPKSSETRRRMSEASRGKKKSEAHCAALRAAKRTPEAIAKSRAAWTPERRARQSASTLARWERQKNEKA